MNKNLPFIGLLFFLLSSSWELIPAQQVFSFNNFTAAIENSILTVSGINGDIVFQRSFNNPSGMDVDLDSDSLLELIIVECDSSGKRVNYNLYVYSVTDTFYPVDSIDSGCIEPYPAESQEVESIILITGDPNFKEYYSSKNEESFLSVNCWKYEGEDLLLINDEIYDVFMSENETICKYIDDYFTSNIKNCDASTRLRSAIVSAYANYIKAGEESLASQFLKKYYLCDDIQLLINKINGLIL